MTAVHFRAGVVVVVRDSRGRVLAFERTDLPGQWQLPQGGIEVGETPRAAAARELEEETGLERNHVRLAGEFPDWTSYEWPDEVRDDGRRLGQTQRWFIFDVTDDSIEPTPDGVEFSSWKWVEPEWLVDNVVDFRRPHYARVLLGHPDADPNPQQHTQLPAAP
jgi:putative (di)nucleoside polyphosphate hydrolase